MYENADWYTFPKDELWGDDPTKEIEVEDYLASPETTTLEALPLPFYGLAYLLRFTDPTWSSEPEGLYFIHLKDRQELLHLNGTSPPIHTANEIAPIQLTEGNVADYLKFFCWFVKGEDGRFVIVEDIDDPCLPKDLDDETRAAVKEFIQPVACMGRNEQGHFICKANMFYEEQLTICEFTIDPETGMIVMA